MSDPLETRLKSIKHILVVLSGKGGVGKSSVSVSLALGLQAQGLRVGIMDVDLCGPSLPRMLRLEGQSIHQSAQGWSPVQTKETVSASSATHPLGCMSIAFLLGSKKDSVVWRGPKKNAMIKQFFQDVAWGPLDYLVIDTPPGTSDEHLSLVEYLRLAPDVQSVIVTTPQAVALSDVRKEVDFCRKTNLAIAGVVENMSGYVCPHCTHCSNVFSTGGGESLATEYGLPFLGRVPLDPSYTATLDGKGSESTGSLLQDFVASPLKPVFEGIVGKIVEGSKTSEGDAE
ncbi:P-loop containing nucleoside triphosphate hydrolase protein [Piptocephalis cylindrospora]|uniref:P-loop containing nucleoside triphosphate hydrolase protein n=1 Tax=Piptocephalis cylindrospora TaxID=1907219 RepID=A0A4P9Y463_9FUNG|nr:P-loop containing nucleoside triphosphate hydrolase protein [Piptocephalis cylindrospora]|eukprot:RKP13746.1 P-loop containing nucleoside triphosphate hydrolase protein [Piptocephalis cylindrospora]